VQRHPNTACSLRGVTYVSGDVPGSAAPFARLADVRVAAEMRDLEFTLGTGQLRFCSPETLSARYPGCRIAPRVRMAAVTIGVRDLAAVRMHCSASGVPVHADADRQNSRRLWVDAPHAAGAIVEFVPVEAVSGETHI
jgi:hypothetical protein